VSARNLPLGRRHPGDDFAVTVSPQSFEFWVDR
jgi:hypothetical protein